MYIWWPGIVLHPTEIPDNILAVKHSPCEFVVRFFGQYDHYWVNRGRVFPFQEGDSGRISSQKSKIDAAFTTAMEHAQRACEILKKMQPNEEEDLDIASSLLPPHYVKLKVNKPAGSVVRRDVDANSLTQCDCDPNQMDPCGIYSHCLNRMLLTECGPTCRAGERCSNRAFEKRQYPRLQAYRTPHRGWGLRTLQDIKQGTYMSRHVPHATATTARSRSGSTRACRPTARRTAAGGCARCRTSSRVRTCPDMSRMRPLQPRVREAAVPAPAGLPHAAPRLGAAHAAGHQAGYVHVPTCPACDRYNRAFEKRQYPRLQAYRTPHRGWGLRTLQDIKQGTYMSRHVPHATATTARSRSGSTRACRPTARRTAAGGCARCRTSSRVRTCPDMSRMRPLQPRVREAAVPAPAGLPHAAPRLGAAHAAGHQAGYVHVPTCPACDRYNRAFEKRQYPRLQAYRTPHRGWGLRTLQDIKQGTYMSRHVPHATATTARSRSGSTRACRPTARRTAAGGCARCRTSSRVRTCPDMSRMRPLQPRVREAAVPAPAGLPHAAPRLGAAHAAGHQAGYVHVPTCPACDRYNRAFEKRQYPRLQAYRTPHRGWGLRTLQDIKQGTYMSRHVPHATATTARSRSGSTRACRPTARRTAAGGCARCRTSSRVRTCPDMSRMRPLQPRVREAAVPAPAGLPHAAPRLGAAHAAGHQAGYVHVPTCPACDRYNRAFEKRQYPRLQAYRTPHRGWGLRTLQDIKQGTYMSRHVPHATATTARSRSGSTRACRPTARRTAAGGCARCRTSSRVRTCPDMSRMRPLQPRVREAAVPAPAGLPHAAPRLGAAHAAGHQAGYVHVPTCPACDRYNRAFEKRQYPRLQAYRTPHRGWGLRTLQDIKQGTYMSRHVPHATATTARSRSGSTRACRPTARRTAAGGCARCRTSSRVRTCPDMSRMRPLQPRVREAAVPAPAGLPHAAPRLGAAHAAGHQAGYVHVPTCPACDRYNRAFEKRQYPRLQAYRTPHRGWGLRTLQDIKQGQFVIEYVGELIDMEEFRRRMCRKHEIRDENFYFLTLDKERMIDAGPKGNLARFMNHCCEPNCETQKWTVLGDVRVGLFALYDIPANSEVTFNYNLECAGIEKKRCLCGAKRCSGYIGAKPKQLQEDKPKLPKRTYKKRKPAEDPKPKPPKIKIKPIKPRELTEIEKDLLIIKNATNGMSSDSEGSRASLDDKNPKALKRKRVSFSTDELGAKKAKLDSDDAV
ncbi:uncharacterized protein LOC125238212 [Leguminivora glycinivorella]|uniref:uncharacterized protein LOC125238212 n=1 Tax=Leguminivora glycinivorella TaxID=1035111 RepID=UPI0020107470|nr:uncharacterized protein LOC125238212 [Leguminivora glycinivorella]